MIHKLENNWECNFCGKPFHIKPYHLKRFKTHYCSKECQNNAKKTLYAGERNHQYGLKGSKNASWKSDSRVTKHGYIQIRCLDHPFRTHDDFVIEHRLVAEKYLLNEENSIEVNGKKYLKKEYVVHHKNEIRTDNRVENLQVMTIREHQIHHNKKNPVQRDCITGRFISKKGKIKQ